MALLCLGTLAAPAAAQGTFQTIDPFYAGENARRSFFGGLALSGELAYRQADLLGLSDPGTPAADLALSGRLDYALLPQVDLSAVLDLSGGVGAGAMGLSWVVVKPYWSNEFTDYAVRVAVDPASEGGLGFRQTDVAFLSTTTLSPSGTSDFAVGLRRVRAGYDTATPGAPPDEPTAQTAALRAYDPTGERVRLVGQELRLSWGYNVLFDPAGSRISIGFLGEAGDYTVIAAASPREPVAERGAAPEDRIQSGTAWVRTGFEWSRPSYQLAPYLSMPLFTWATVRGEPVQHGPRPDKVRAGVRLTLR